MPPLMAALFSRSAGFPLAGTFFEMELRESLLVFAADDGDIRIGEELPLGAFEIHKGALVVRRGADELLRGVAPAILRVEQRVEKRGRARGLVGTGRGRGGLQRAARLDEFHVGGERLDRGVFRLRFAIRGRRLAGAVVFQRDAEDETRREARPALVELLAGGVGVSPPSEPWSTRFSSGRSS